MASTTRKHRRAAAATAMGRAANRPASNTAPPTEANTSAASDLDDEQRTDSLLDSVTAPTAADIREVQQTAAEHVDQLYRYPLTKVAPHPANPPERLAVTEDLRSLGENIRANGLHQPIVLAARTQIEADDPAAAAQLPDTAEWVIIAGHRRYGSCQLAGVEELPGLLRTGPCDPATIAGIFLDENLHREKPDPIMEAQAYQRMKDAGMSTTEIAASRGKQVSQSHVSKTMSLQRLPDHVGTEIRAGRMTRADAYEYLKLDETEQEPVFQAWRNDQQTASPRSLRVIARRRAREAAEQPSLEHPQVIGEEAQEANSHHSLVNGSQRGALPTAETYAAVLAMSLTPTVRADILGDAALIADTRADGHSPSWRESVGDALGLDLPNYGPLDEYDVPQATWRKLAVGRALWLLDAEVQRHSDASPAPPHVDRHLERLRVLGVL